MFLDGSIIAQYFYIGLGLLVVASFVAGYIELSHPLKILLRQNLLFGRLCQSVLCQH